MGRTRPLVRSLLLGSLVLTLGLAVATAGDAEVERKLAELAKASAPDAIAGLETLLEEVTDPADQAQIRERLAWRHVSSGNPYASLEHFEVLVQEPTEARVHIAYAEALILTGRKNLGTGNTTAAGVVPYLMDARETLEHVDVASIDDTLRGRFVRAQGESYFYEGDFAKALAALPTAQVDKLAEPYRTLCWQLRGQIQYRTGDYEEAAAAFKTGGNGRGVAASWSAAKNGAKAVAAYTELLMATPHDLQLLSEATAAVRYAGGVAELEAALADVPVEGAWKARYLVARADLRRQSDDAAGAVELLRDAAALDTAFVDPLVQIARLHLSDVSGDPEENRAKAVEALLEALTRNPTHEATTSSLWHLAGQDYQVLWKDAGSGPALQRTLRIQRALLKATPDDALGWANLGNTLRVGGLTDEALAAYARAKQENPYDPAILSDEGLALSAAGRFEEALAAYIASVELDGSHRAGLQNAGRSLWLKGDDAGAQARLGAAVKKARPLGRNPMTYRFLLDRAWRTQQDEALR